MAPSDFSKEMVVRMNLLFFFWNSQVGNLWEYSVAMCMEAAHNLLWCGHLVVCLWTQTIVGGRLFLLIVRCFFCSLVSISWWSRDVFIYDDASVNVKAVDPQFSMNILLLYIFDVVARPLCGRNAMRLCSPSQDNRLREIRNLLLLKQRSVDKKASGSMFGKLILRRTMLWKSSVTSKGACASLSFSRINMLCSTGSSKSVCSYMSARKRTEMTSRVLVL